MSLCQRAAAFNRGARVGTSAAVLLTQDRYEQALRSGLRGAAVAGPLLARRSAPRSGQALGLGLELREVAAARAKLRG
jgi:hypothetical protein